MRTALRFLTLLWRTAFVLVLMSVAMVAAAWFLLLIGAV